MEGSGEYRERSIRGVGSCLLVIRLKIVESSQNRQDVERYSPWFEIYEGERGENCTFTTDVNERYSFVQCTSCVWRN